MGKKRQRVSHVEYYFAFKDGWRPIDLIRRGIDKPTAYAYYRRFRKMDFMGKYLNLLKMPPQIISNVDREPSVSTENE